MAKKFISALLKLLALTWMIVAYFMIRSMELKNQSEKNRKEITMDIIRFHVVLWSCVFAPLVIIVVNKLFSPRCFDPFMTFLTPILLYANISILYEAWTYNSEVPEKDTDLPTESNFLLIIFYAVTFCTVITCLFLIMVVISLVHFWGSIIIEHC